MAPGTRAQKFAVGRAAQLRVLCKGGDNRFKYHIGLIERRRVAQPGAPWPAPEQSRRVSPFARDVGHSCPILFIVKLPYSRTH